MDARSVTHVLYHAECADGFGAAFAAWQVLGDVAHYIAVHHGAPPPPLPPHARVAIVDFSYKKDVISQLKSRVMELLILDHHTTAQEELRGLDFAVFNLDKSGARLAWEFWHPEDPIPELLAYIEDKDLWRWQLQDSQEVSLALHSYPLDFKVWQTLNVDRLRVEGKALKRLQDKLIQDAVKRARWETLFGYRVPIVNATEFRSEIANRLCSLYPDTPFAAAYHDDHQGERCWSLRSLGDFDVAELARQVGGGGHKNASGFNGPLISALRSSQPGTLVDQH